MASLPPLVLVARWWRGMLEPQACSLYIWPRTSAVLGRGARVAPAAPSCVKDAEPWAQCIELNFWADYSVLPCGVARCHSCFATLIPNNSVGGSTTSLYYTIDGACQGPPLDRSTFSFYSMVHETTLYIAYSSSRVTNGVGIFRMGMMHVYCYKM